MASLIIRSRLLTRSCNLKWASASVSSTTVRFSDADVASKQKEASQIKNDLALLKPEEAEQRKKLQGYITSQGPSDISPISGIPEEHIKGRMVRIYEPPKNAMQSGTDNIGFWEMEFDTRERWENPLMGWASTGDPMSNVKIQFTSRDDAIAYCVKNGWQYFVQEGTVKPMRPKSYGVNFSWNRRTRTSTK